VIAVGVGLHTIPLADYLADPCETPSVSAHALMTLLSRSPAHAHREHPRYGAQRDDGSSAADMGSAAHAMLLGGEERIVFVEAKDWRTKAAQETRDAARAAGQIPILEWHRKDLAAAVHAALDALSDASIDFDPAQAEQTAIWQEGDLWCRARPDLIAPTARMVIDYKTTANAAPAAWIRSTLVGAGYHIGFKVVAQDGRTGCVGTGLGDDVGLGACQVVVVADRCGRAD